MSGKKDLYSKGSGSGLHPYFPTGCKITHSWSWKSDGIFRRNYRQINIGKQWEMVRGVTFFQLRLNNFRGLDPDRRGDKNIVQFEPEKISTKPMISNYISTIWISYTKGVYQRLGVEYTPLCFDS
jgi:hypothetical protein